MGMEESERRVDAIEGAVQEVAEATRLFRETVKRECPVGALVEWEHGNHTRSGWVERHQWGSRVQVRSCASGKKMQICATRFTAIW